VPDNVLGISIRQHERPSLIHTLAGEHTYLHVAWEVHRTSSNNCTQHSCSRKTSRSVLAL